MQTTFNVSNFNTNIRPTTEFRRYITFTNGKMWDNYLLTFVQFKYIQNYPLRIEQNQIDINKCNTTILEPHEVQKT